MLTRGELVTLERSLRGAHVLSVYLEGTAADPAVQHAWRVHLDHALDDLRTALAASLREEREQFAACVRLLEIALGAPGTRSGAPGWVAFITAETVRYSSPVLASMATLAVWDSGACVAPYLRALKENRPVVLAVVDARKAIVYHYRLGRLERVATLHSHHALERPAHMGDAPRVGFHTGTRGLTGRDAAQRTRLAGMKRMLAELAERATALAGDEGWVLIGGIPRVVAHAARLLTPVRARVLPLDSLDVHASAAELADAARTGASALRDAWDDRELAEIIALAEAGALGVLGPAATQLALARSIVRTLFVSERYLTQHPAEAAEVVRRALDQSAAIEEVSRTAAHRLDEHGGVAARLRYRVASDAGPSPALRNRASGTVPVT